MEELAVVLVVDMEEPIARTMSAEVTADPCLRNPMIALVKQLSRPSLRAVNQICVEEVVVRLDLSTIWAG